MKKALITGINGQDGSYLAEFLLDKGYDVYGILKRNSVSENQTFRIDHIRDKIKLFYGDILDLASLISVVKDSQPDELYNLAAQSHVRISFDMPVYTTQTNCTGTLNVLEAVRMIKPDAKIYQASSSEMFGNSIDTDNYQRENTPMHPVSPYGCSKLFGFNLVKNYRHSYNMFISNGILFNHESPRRGTNFVTNKICKEVVKIKLGLSNQLSLGNLLSTRDWGHAKDYVRAMWQILNLDQSDDFVCATGISHSVEYLVDYTFDKLNLNKEKSLNIDPRFFRPEELYNLKGDSSKLKNKTGWNTSYTFESMIDEMIDYWFNIYKK
jgi:GDPmannose 4,6-dehydratase